MYNRYIPGNNGIYQRQVMDDPCCDAPAPASSEPCEQSAPSCDRTSARHPLTVADSLDLGDLLLLCVLLLLLLDADQNDMLSLFITAAAFILIQ